MKPNLNTANTEFSISIHSKSAAATVSILQLVQKNLKANEEISTKKSPSLFKLLKTVSECRM